jgi:nucleotide-binding universal stress UspA family protein
VFTSMVIALDLEREGDRALPIARSLSALTDVPVELLTVQSPGLPEEADAYELRRRADANGWTDASCTVLQSNEPADAIADHVNARPGALLVMATTAKSPVRQHFLGSVSEGVLNRVRRPVLLVGPHVPAGADMSRPTLVVCVDSTEAATRARPVVTAWMRTFKSASPWVVEVLPAPLERLGVGRDMVESAYVKFLAQQLSNAEVDASWEVLHGADVGGRLEEFIGTVDDPVLVATSTNWTDEHTHWHSTTRRLVQRSTRPVLVIPGQRDTSPR